MELADYLRVMRERWIAVTVTTIACGVAAFTYSSLQPQVYAATSSGFVTNGPAGDPTVATANDALSKSRAASYIGLATDRETASIVIADLGLDTSPEAVVGNIEASQTPDTVIINIVAKAATPEGAQQLADSWMSALAERVSDVESVDGEQGLRIEVAESALLPTSPISPLVGRSVLLALVLGALLGAGYAVVRTLVDRRLRSADEVETASGVSVLGSVPNLGSASGVLVTAGGAPASAQAAEEVRRLRTNLAYMDVSGQPRSIVVTSPHQGDGKTTIAVNLAAAIALTGQRVTLVDADMRDSNLARARGLDAAVGLTDVLRGDLELDTALLPDPEVAGLSVLSAGKRPSNPTELLSSDAMRSIMKELASRGTVIVDAPPLLAVTDAAIVAHFADGALVVVNADVTRDADLMTTIEHLRAVHARPLGVVLNQGARKRKRGRRNSVRSVDGYGGSTEPADRKDTVIIPA